MKNPFLAAIFCALCQVCLLQSAPAAILLSDDFNTVVSGANINGRTPNVNNVNSNNWVASTATFLGNGSGGLSATATSTTPGRSASIDLGADYLANNPGIYEMSLTITQPTSTALSWLGFGFSQGNDVAQNLVGNNGNPWMLFRLNGSVNVYGGAGVSNQLTNGGSTVPNPATVTAPRDVPNVFTLLLDTSVPNWTLNASINGVPVDVNGSDPGLAYTFVTNPTLSRYATFSAGYNTAAGTGTIDNFSLSVTPIPEPSSVALALSGLGWLTWRLARRKHA
jgi:hypothetical protein